MSSSCSFRITRTAEDLAVTLTALSQRLVKLEQRQEALELLVSENQIEPLAEEVEMLDGVDNLLRECQELLESSSHLDHAESDCPESDEEDILAA